MMCTTSLPLFTLPKVSSEINSIAVTTAASMAAISSTNCSSDLISRCSNDKAGYLSNVNGMKMPLLKSLLVATTRHQSKRRFSTSYPISVAAASASPLFCGQVTKDSYGPKFYQDVLKAAREKFTEEISFQSKDKDISLAKTLLYVAAEDEAFMAFNREMDARSVLNERKDVPTAADSHNVGSLELLTLAGKTITEWLNELDAIVREVEAELVPRDIGCHLVEVIEAVNVVLFESRCFKRVSIAVEPKGCYLHGVLSSGYGSAILLSIIYIEVCQRLGLTMLGSRVGEDFLIWPRTENPEELFKVTSGHSLFAVVNGRCVEDPRSMASDLNGDSLSSLDIVSNRDIIGIALANLIRLHWKRASRSNHGLMLTSALRLVHDADKKHEKMNGSNQPLLRPKDLRLAIMASERLLILQPHNWSLRRDNGMMLYYNRQYGEAVQELSICMAFAPEEEAALLEPFVEKLHLMRLESTWKSFGHAGQLTAL
ncbi:uncharacterized protein LOC130804719 isoform X1 [Amaranthus tricolor]|uniref:uncharacterized protein LOC130804719 isoform X1 n=2 Tax=Amaranthus tricolor TaxID=29722 RepID=UPI00258C8802|nr:uncharacterized protein LOC130804719 isoform X1 [Amaranthus tricolor]